MASLLSPIASVLSRLALATVVVIASGALGAGCRSAATAVRSDADSTAQTPGRVTSIPGYTEYYRVLGYTGLEKIVFCSATSDPRGEPYVYAVARDLEGRPTTISRYFFGNLDTRAEWQTMRIEYKYFPSSAQLVERRTWHDAAGAPMEVRGGFGREIVYKNGLITLTRLIDRNGKPVGGIPIAVRSLYREERPGTIVQEWFFGNGKQYFGIGTDEPGHAFGDMPPQAYFRRFTVDARGFVTREEVWGLEKRAIPYPGGEIVRAYEHNECGQVTEVVYLDEEGKPRPNASGIAREKREYDAKGRIAEWQAFGPTGTPRGRYEDGAAALRFVYRDFDGQLLTVERYDVNGNRIEEAPQSEP